MRGGRDKHEDECSLRFDSRTEDNLDSVMLRQAGALTDALTGLFEYVLISLSDGRVCV